MSEIRRTISYEKINLRERLNLPMTIPSVEQLNFKYNVLTNKPLVESSVYPKLKFWGLGIGGDTLGSVRIPNKRNLTLYNLIPLRVNLKTDIFESDELRDDYRLRVALNSDRVIVPLNSSDITHYMYFLKKLKNKNNESQLTTITGLEDNDDIFEYNSTNIQKYLTGIVNDDISSKLKYYNPNDINERNVITKTELRLNINKNDIDSVINYFDDESYGSISEIGLFTGLDTSIEDGTLTYNEAYAVQLGWFNTFISQDFRHKLQSTYNVNFTII